MINSEIFRKIRSRICAIGYTTVSNEIMLKDPTKPFFKVVGTGFLVAPELVMTNRHVVEGLLLEQSEFGFPDDQYKLMFVHPTKPTRWQVDFCGVTRMGHVTNADIDIGMIEFTRPATKEFDKITPIEFQSGFSYEISESIALCGYPYGHSMLQRDGKVYRWGPILQQGFISAISPFENTGKPNELLLDIRIAGGMSGSPLVRSSDGKVIGIVHSAWEFTTALALPLNQEMFSDLLRQYHEQKEKK